MMSRETTQLRADFQFSQASLQDYVECARRFQLRYVERVAWPAPQAQPISEYEQRLERGQVFHRLVQQQLLGIPEAKLTPADPELRRWWEAYLAARPAALEGRRYIEAGLAATVAGKRLMAQYDLVLLTPHAALIFDWKTSERPQKSGAVERLFERMQTRVYRYLLVRAGADLNGGRPLAPEQVTMTYWFAETPAEPVTFAYSPHRRHRRNLRARSARSVGAHRGGTALRLLPLSFPVRAGRRGRGAQPRRRNRGARAGAFRPGLRADRGDRVLRFLIGIESFLIGIVYVSIRNRMRFNKEPSTFQ